MGNPEFHDVKEAKGKANQIRFEKNLKPHLKDGWMNIQMYHQLLVDGFLIM